MKRNIKLATVAIIALISTAFTANAEVKPYKSLDSKEVITHYVDASLLGSVDYTKYMFTDDFEYQNTTNKDKFGKKAYMTFLKSVKDLKYNATQKIDIIDQVGNTTIGKVSMDFGTFTRVDYITLLQTEDGWKINKVVTTYP